MAPVSPPDNHGYCSFGPGVWFSRRIALGAKTVIAEVHENHPHRGENFIHISQIDRFCEADKPTGNLPIPPRTEEETFVTEVICTLVASELVHDRDTIQMGVGTVSAALGLYLTDKQTSAFRRNSSRAASRSSWRPAWPRASTRTCTGERWSAAPLSPSLRKRCA
jgi:4-hydroxybutyrate CoA-transferase